jgi:hypothetical protein
MKKNTWFMAGIAAAVLVFTMVFSACPQDASEGDTWSKVTKLEELDGTWKGSYSETKTMKEFMEEAEEEWDETTAEAFGDMKVTSSMEITSTFNAAAKTSKVATKMTVAFSGGKINDVWGDLKSSLGSSDDTVTVVTDDSNHSITFTIPEEEETLTDEGIAELLDGSIEINQDGTKVKIAAGTLDDSAPEIIMHKQ